MGAMHAKSELGRRFVLLRHRMPEDCARASHWDLMIEDCGTLATWALSARPDVEREQKAERLPDHRLAYLSYQGPLSSNLGDVERWDGGICELLEQIPSRWKVVLQGMRLQGELTLSRSSDGSWATRFVGSLSSASASPEPKSPGLGSLGPDSPESGSLGSEPSKPDSPGS